MTRNERIPFDFGERAENGLRRGVTTGTCATGAVKAALTYLLKGTIVSEVRVNLVDGVHYAAVPVLEVAPEPNDGVKAVVRKDAGDDPDATHKAKIFAIVRRNKTGSVRFLAGSGVGTFTLPGCSFPPGEPAINPVPRKMMTEAVQEIRETHYESRREDAENPRQQGNDDNSPLKGRVDHPLDKQKSPGFDLTIGCIDGEKIAEKTYNPRLGILGGISILGTTGIVEPKSLSSYLASIELYIRIAVADQPKEIVLAPGNLGQEFAADHLGFSLKRIVQMSNFIGFSLDSLDNTLDEFDFELDRLWVAGHPGKLAKLLDDNWDTHSGKSEIAVRAVSREAEKFGFGADLIRKCEKSITVEGVAGILESEKEASLFWSLIESRIADIIRPKIRRTKQIAVRLFRMNGAPLAEVNPAHRRKETP